MWDGVCLCVGAFVCLRAYVCECVCNVFVLVGE